MITRKVTIKNSAGLNVEAAGIMVNVAVSYRSLIEFKKGSNCANAKSVLSILGSSVMEGDEIEIICDGPDENEAMDEIVSLIESGMDM